VVGGGGEVEMVWEVLLCGCKSALGGSVLGGVLRWGRGRGRGGLFRSIKTGFV